MSPEAGEDQRQPPWSALWLASSAPDSNSFATLSTAPTVTEVSRDQSLKSRSTRASRPHRVTCDRHQTAAVSPAVITSSRFFAPHPEVLKMSVAAAPSKAAAVASRAASGRMDCTAKAASLASARRPRSAQQRACWIRSHASSTDLLPAATSAFLIAVIAALIWPCSSSAQALATVAAERAAGSGAESMRSTRSPESSSSNHLPKAPTRRQRQFLDRAARSREGTFVWAAAKRW